MFTVSQIASKVNGVVEGDPEMLIKDVCDLRSGKPDCISFLVDNKHAKLISETKASAIFVSKNVNHQSQRKTFIKVDNPALAFINTMSIFHPQESYPSGIHESAVISDDVKIGKDVYIAPLVVIESNAIIGNNVSIGSGSSIGKNVSIGSASTIASNVCVYHDVKIGHRAKIESGTVIGADGFGLVTDNGKHHQYPHIGTVIIGDDVLIGANGCIDRGTLTDTIIGDGSKLDNLIQIGHNVIVGKGCVIAGQTGIAGSSQIGNYVVMGGQVGINGHISIGDKVMIGAKSIVFQSVESGKIVSGIPAKDHTQRRKQDVIINQLPDIIKRIRAVENKTENIKKD